MSAPAISMAPCAKCPFRKDIPIYLRPERREEIVEALRDGLSFPCHESVDWHEAESDDDEPYYEGGETECAGAVKALLAAGGTTQMTRIAERLGIADADVVAARGVDVWALDQWPRLAEGSTGDAPAWEEGDEDGVETCNTVNGGCLAPAGYLGTSGAVVSGTVAADGECGTCGEACCTNCLDDGGLCGYCTEDEDDGEEW